MKRELIPDIIKGIAIILVVVGHADSPFTKFLFYFHVSIFFMVSGIFISQKHYESVKSVFKYIVSKIKRLYLPFVGLGTVFVLLHNTFIKMNIYTDNVLFLVGDRGNSIGISHVYDDILKQLFYTVKFIPTEPLIGSVWFLRILFFSLVLYVVCRFLIKKIRFVNEDIAVLTLSIVFLWVSKQNHDPFYFIYAAFSLHASGKYLYTKFRTKDFSKYENIIYAAASAILINFIGNNSLAAIDISANIIGNPLVFIVLSFLGYFMVYNIAVLVSKSKLAPFLSYIGKSTMMILCLHMIGFKFVTYAVVKLQHLPIYRLASSPVYDGSGYMWVIYTIAGLALPLALTVCYNGISNFIEERKTKNNS